MPEILQTLFFRTRCSMMALPYGEEIIIVGRTMWTQSTSVTDRQTDRRTELLSQQEAQLLLGDRATRKHAKDS